MLIEKVLKPGNYYGEFAKRRHVSSLTLTEVVYPQGHRTPRHTHERAYFSLALQGMNDIIRDTGRQTCQPSTVMFHPAGVLHAEQVRRAKSRSFFVEIEPSLLERVGDHLKLRSGSVAFNGGLAIKAAARLYREFRRMDEVAHLAIEGLVLEMLAECARNAARVTNRKMPRWLSQAREIIHEHPTEGLSLSVVAHLVGVHPVYLATEFRRFYGCTVGDYARRLRVEAARRELLASDRPLAEIAAHLGFAHQAHFTRAFKEYAGLTPSEYRRRFGKT